MDMAGAAGSVLGTGVLGSDSSIDRRESSLATVDSRHYPSSLVVCPM